MSSTPSVGLSAFDSLRAEDEPWLDRCYVLPAQFDLMAGARSCLVFGSTGSGKTALYRALREHLSPSADAQGQPARLVVEWRPAAGRAVPAGRSPEEHEFRSVLGACAEALLDHVASWPGRLTAAPADAQQIVGWFLFRYLGGSEQPLGEARDSTSRTQARSRLHSLRICDHEDEWLSNAEPSMVVGELVKALRPVGVQTVYVLLGPDAVDGSDAIKRALRSFFSTLTLFENPRFLYKAVLSDELKPQLEAAGSVARRRIDVYSLKWSAEDLGEIVARRIAVAAHAPPAALSGYCEDPGLPRWLKRTGGESPRGWLEAARPLAAEYLRRRRAIPAEEWQEIRAASPPPLYFDEAGGKVTVGWCQSTVSEVPLALLSYLWENRDRACSRRELFYYAWLPSRYPDTPLEEIHEYPKDYDHIIESAINRLREKIEPDPKAPVYVVTYPKEGYKLEHAW